jgi:hypothetical protein
MPAEVVGVKDVQKGLSFIDEDMYNRIKMVVTPLMRQVESKAKGYVPTNSQVLSGWSKPISSDISYRPFPKYNADSVKGGIGYKEGKNKQFRNGFQVENYVYNINAAGRIYETAGRLNPQGRAPFQMTASQGASGTYVSKTRTGRSVEQYDSNNPFAGYQFVTSMPTLTSQPKIKDVRGGGRKTKGRLIYKAFAEESPKIYESILGAINKTADYFNNSTELKKVA